MQEIARKSLCVVVILFPLTIFSQDFEDVSQVMGIEHTFLSNNSTYGGGVSFVDFNGDGLCDLVILD